MRILYIHTYYKQRGGEDAVFESEREKMRICGHNVHSLIFRNDQRTLLKFISFPFNFISFFRLLIKILKVRPQVIHIHNFHFAASPSIIWAGILFKIPIVVTLHNYRLVCPSAIFYHKGQLFLDSLNNPRFPWAAVKRGVYKDSAILSFWVALTYYLHKKIGTWKKVSRYITLTEFSRQIYLRSNLKVRPERFVVKPNFIEGEDITNSVEKKDFIYVGRLSDEKGIDIILEAFKKLRCNLTIIGDGPFRKQVESFASQNRRIRYLGFQSKEVIRREIRRASALIFASKCYEGMPMTILEAFSEHTPVIAASLGAIPDIVVDSENGLLFEANNSGDLVKKIEMWHSMSDLLKVKYYKNSYTAFTNYYSSNSNSSRLISIYSSVI